MIKKARRVLRISIEILIGLLIGLSLIGGFVAWRLTQEGAMPMTFLAPALQQSLSPENSPFSIKIADVALVWDDERGNLDLRARGVSLSHREGGSVATVPELSLTLSPRALLNGQVAPSGIAIIGLRIHANRNQEGLWSLGLDTNQLNQQSDVKPDAEILATALAMLRQPELLPPGLRYLQRVGLRGGDLSVTDALGNRSWQAGRINLDLLRRTDGAAGVEGNFTAEVEDLGRPALVAGAGSFDATTGEISFSLTADQLSMEDMLEQAALSQTISAPAMSIKATVTGKWSLSEAYPSILNIDAETPGGEVIVPDWFDRPVPVGPFMIAGTWTGADNQLKITQAAGKIATTQTTAQLQMRGLDFPVADQSPLDITGQVKIDQAPMENLPILWPKPMAAGGRQWVAENITAGTIQNIIADGTVMIDEATGEVANVKVKGSLSIKDGVVHYLRPLTPAENIQGTMQFNEREFTADLASPAKVQDLMVDSMHVVINGFDVSEQAISAEGSVKGPLTTALALLDNDRFAYARKLNLDPKSAEGSVDAKLRVEFPAIHDLTFEKVDIAADAMLKDTALRKVFLERDLTGGALTLKIDKQMMEVKGDAIFGDIPVDLTWLQRFNADKDGELSLITVKGRPDTQQMAAAGFEFRPYVTGLIGTDLVYRRFDSGTELIDGAFNLDTAIVRIEPLRWEKGPGQSASGTMTLELKNGKPVFLRQMGMEGADLKAIGSGRFGDDGKLASLYFTKLQLGNSDLREVTLDLSGAVKKIRVNSGVFDATRFVSGSPLFEKETREPSMDVPFEIETIALNQLILGEDRKLEDVVMTLQHDGAYWDRIRVNAVLPGGAALHIQYEPVAGEPKHKLDMVAADAGAALKVLDIAQTVTEGQMSLSGMSDDTDPDRPLQARLEIEGFRLAENSLIIRLLSIATLTAVLDELTGEGYAFSRLQADLTKRNGRIDIAKLRARGPSLGFTSAGWVDFDSNQLALSGEVVPAYFFNSLIGNIPLIGPIIIGGEGEGLFAISYSANGTLDDPQFVTNPLSVLTPGFLRDIFDLTPGQSSSGGDEAPVRNDSR